MTGVITFGAEAAQIYEKPHGRGEWMKALRL